jgi:hypothetical protein
MIRKTALLVLGLVIISLALISSAYAANDSSSENVIHASGTGTIIGTPDRAQVTFSVQTENSDVKAAQAENAANMNKVFDALVASGLTRDSLKTTSYNIYPVYEDSTGILTPKIKTYRVTNTLTVTLHDVSKTGEVIDVAVANGVNQADSIQFMLSDEQSQLLRTEALKKAVLQARTDADTVAAAMGTGVTGVKSADISGGYSPVLFQNYQNDLSTAAKSVAPTPIQPGDVTVTAQVTITYTIH